MLHDGDLAQAILDRILERGRVFTLDGPSMRTKRRERPTGRVRLVVTPMSATMVFAPTLLECGRRFPDVVLDAATTQEGRTELVAAGFDAGIHLGESWARYGCCACVARSAARRC